MKNEHREKKYFNTLWTMIEKEYLTEKLKANSSEIRDIAKICYLYGMIEEGMIK